MDQPSAEMQPPIEVGVGAGSIPEEAQPDIHSATDGYAQRFASRAGQYFLQTQLKSVQRLIEPFSSGSVLDVGGGHAQVAPALVDAGYDVTVHGSNASCRTRPDRFIGADRYRFISGSLLSLPVEDQSFDIVIALRMMAHISEPMRFIDELCRVARKAVILDFSCHSAKIGGGARTSYRIKNWAEQNTTRQFRTQSPSEIAAAFQAQGLTPDQSIAQYALPMVLHRRLNCPPISRTLEGAARVTGITRLIGSPVVLRARR